MGMRTGLSGGYRVPIYFVSFTYTGDLYWHFNTEMVNWLHDISEVANGSWVKIPGPARRVSMKLRISLPTVPTRSPSPEQTTLPASATAVTATLSGQPFTCLQIQCTVLEWWRIQYSQEVFYSTFFQLIYKKWHSSVYSVSQQSSSVLKNNTFCLTAWQSDMK
jgi:hypothetical protein